jgi:hypothetical protein
MRTACRLMLCFVLASLAVWRAPADAAPWREMLNIRQIDADPRKEYWLTEDNGPWCILAASFAGEKAPADAHALVLELRKRFGLEAYMHKQRYDFSEPVTGLGVDEFGAPKRMRHLHGGAYDEIAVLVGDYNGVEDPAVEKTLEKLKYAHPESLQSGPRRETTQRFAEMRAFQRRFMRDTEQRKKGPMRSAFVTRNPLLPKEFFSPGGIDKFVLDMNQHVPHSLLDCPGKYSVRIATFRGVVELDQRKIRDIEQGGAMNSRLDVAAERAHKLTETLRAKGVEAYEFHDRYESVVTVGNFNTVGTPRTDGRIEINPAVHHVMNTYGPAQQALPVAGAAPGLMPKIIAGIALDVQPMPVEVPQRSIAADYARP